jgi:arabinose-5-phosphate isomerase
MNSPSRTRLDTLDQMHTDRTNSTASISSEATAGIAQRSTELKNEAAALLNAEAAALQRTASRLDEHSFAEAVALLHGAGTIVLTGIGKSGIVAQKIAATLTSTGSRALFLHPVEALHGDVGIVQRGDVVVALSKSGSTAEILALVPTLSERSVPMIGLLGTPVNTPLAGLCRVVLDASVEHEASPLGIAPMSSTMVAMALGDALAAALMRLRSFTAQDFAVNHAAGQLGRNLTMRVADVMHSGAALPCVPEGASFREILAELTAKGLGCVCVIATATTAPVMSPLPPTSVPLPVLRGIITDGDIRRALQQHHSLESLRTSDMMSAAPLTVRDNALLGTALELMEDRPRQISVLPVVGEHAEVLGIIRIHDIVRAGM